MIVAALNRKSLCTLLVMSCRAMLCQKSEWAQTVTCKPSKWRNEYTDTNERFDKSLYQQTQRHKYLFENVIETITNEGKYGNAVPVFYSVDHIIQYVLFEHVTRQELLYL